MSRKHYRRETRYVSVLLVHVPDLAALLDMLRYDRCVPFDQDETAKLYRLLGERDGGGRGKSTPKDRILRLIRYSANADPTPVGRWESYQCTVIDERSPDDVQMSDEDALRQHEISLALAKRAKARRVVTTEFSSDRERMLLFSRLDLEERRFVLDHRRDLIEFWAIDKPIDEQVMAIKAAHFAHAKTFDDKLAPKTRFDSALDGIAKTSPIENVFARPIMIHVCKDGTVTYRDKTKKEKVFNGVALPVFSVDTVEEAKRIQSRHCRLMYGAHPHKNGPKDWYVLNEFSGELEDLDRVMADFATYWAENIVKTDEAKAWARKLRHQLVDKLKRQAAEA